MCELFALSSRYPLAASFSLSGFFQRGGGSGDHRDGWGLALFREGAWDIHAQTSPAFSCARARGLVGNTPLAAAVIAHIRKATVGEVRSENTHPFIRKLWGRDWVFAHNGDLKDFRPTLCGDLMPRGSTDSELAFCLMLEHLGRQFAVRPPDRDLAPALKQIGDSLAEWGTFNFLLGDGDTLFAYCTTELYWTARLAPFAEVGLLDCDLRIDLGARNRADNHMCVIATKPLTRGEVWYPMGRGELRAFAAGSNNLALAPSTPSAGGEFDLIGGTGRIRIVY